MYPSKNSSMLDTNCVFLNRFIVSPCIKIVKSIARSVGRYSDLPMTSLNFLWVLHVFASPITPIVVSIIPSMNAERTQGIMYISPLRYLVVPYMVMFSVDSEIRIPIWNIFPQRYSDTFICYLMFLKFKVVRVLTICKFYKP